MSALVIGKKKERVVGTVGIGSREDARSDWPAVIARSRTAFITKYVYIIIKLIVEMIINLPFVIVSPYPHTLHNILRIYCHFTP